MATVIKVCTCRQCRHVKRKSKNRKLKKVMKRLINKKRRKGKDGEVINIYWA